MSLCVQKKYYSYTPQTFRSIRHVHYEPPPSPSPPCGKKADPGRFNKILLPFHLIFILSLKRTFLLSGSQSTRLYCTSGLPLEIKESWQLCIMSSNIILNEPIFTKTQSLNLLVIFIHFVSCTPDGFCWKEPNLLAKRVRGRTKFASVFGQVDQNC